MARASLDWNGNKLLARAAEASRKAIDDTLQAADHEASTSHVWQNRTTQLEEEIVVEQAVVDGDRVAGSFGTTQRRGFYGLFHEEGTVHEFARPFLRPAADRSFPTLLARIRRRLR